MALRPFLLSHRAALPSPPSIVLGNSAADLDSFASSILYSFLHPSHPTPYLAIPRADIALRPELQFLLSTLHLNTTDLITADDGLSSLPYTTTVHLVDHNRLTLPTSFKVLGVVDHHDDEGLYPSADPRIITPAGSCTSLIVESLWHSSHPVASEAEVTALATLALAPILVDTANMTKRVTAHDDAAMSRLESLLPVGIFDRGSYYSQLDAAKRDIANMPVYDLLRKDYKEWTSESSGIKAGISSIVKNLEWVRSQAGFEDAIRKWADESALDVLGIMTTDGSGEDFRRDLLLWEVSPKAQGVLQRFERAAGSLQLESWEGGLEERRRVWRQRNTKASRKQVAPLLRDCLEGSGPGLVSQN